MPWLPTLLSFSVGRCCFERAQCPHVETERSPFNKSRFLLTPGCWFINRLVSRFSACLSLLKGHPPPRLLFKESGPRSFFAGSPRLQGPPDFSIWGQHSASWNPEGPTAARLQLPALAPSFFHSWHTTSGCGELPEFLNFRFLREHSCWCSAGDKEMTPINHPLWNPLRGLPGSFPHSLLSTSKIFLAHKKFGLTANHSRRALLTTSPFQSFGSLTDG